MFSKCRDKFFLNLLLRICFLNYFKERGMEREREDKSKGRKKERERNIHRFSNLRSILKLRYVPWQWIKPAAFWCMGRCSNQLLASVVTNTFRIYYSICVFHSATRKDDRKYIGVNMMILTKNLKLRRQRVSAACLKVGLHYFTFTWDLTVEHMQSIISFISYNYQMAYLKLHFFYLIYKETCSQKLNKLTRFSRQALTWKN